MKTSLVRRPVLLAAALALLVLTARPARADDGLFADFTTSYGPFTCQLDYTAAPKAVANFVGLATGAQPWLNLPNGRVRSTPFYDGLLFHRVISGFMIQGGSPNAQGTDGPGYVFTDECSPILRFDGPGVLAMANSGTNSNGAQFFITVAATAWLNDVHTIFGRVVSGQPVVTAISLAAVDTSSKPLTNIVIQKVAIRRVGAAALAFNINAQGLPVMTNTPVALTSSPGRADLVYSNRPFAANTLYSSTNLAQWTSLSLGVDPGAPATNAFSKTNTGPPGVLSRGPGHVSVLDFHSALGAQPDLRPEHHRNRSADHRAQRDGRRHLHSPGVCQRNDHQLHLDTGALHRPPLAGLFLGAGAHDPAPRIHQHHRRLFYRHRLQRVNLHHRRQFHDDALILTAPPSASLQRPARGGVTGELVVRFS